MPSPPSRRAFLTLTSGVALSLAGCLDISDLPDLELLNTMSRDITVTTLIERVADAETVLSDTTTIVQDGSHRYQNPIREKAAFLIRVSVEGASEESYEWDAPADESYGLTVHLSEDGVSFSPIVS